MFAEVNSMKVMNLFFRYPNREFYVREIARLTKLSPSGILKITKRLEKEELILRKKGKVTENFVANRDSEEFISLKRTFNIYFLFDSGLISELTKQYNHPECVVVFGSYVKAEDIETSDIDIAIITGKELSLNLKKFEEKLGRTISIHQITNLNKSSKEFKNSLANGIVLYGYLKVV